MHFKTPVKVPPSLFFARIHNSNQRTPRLLASGIHMNRLLGQYFAPVFVDRTHRFTRNRQPFGGVSGQGAALFVLQIQHQGTFRYVTGDDQVLLRGAMIFQQ